MLRVQSRFQVAEWHLSALQLQLGSNGLRWIQESELWKPGNPFTYGCIVHYLPLYNYCIMLHQRVDNGEHDVHLFGHRIPDTPILCPHFNGQKIGDRHDGSNNYDKLMLKSRMLENSNVHSFP